MPSLGQLNYGKYLCALGKFRSVGQASHCSSFPMMEPSSSFLQMYGLPSLK